MYVNDLKEKKKQAEIDCWVAVDKDGIEKIIGRKLTWDDEPVKINFNNQITNKTDEQNNL